MVTRTQLWWLTQAIGVGSCVVVLTLSQWLGLMAPVTNGVQTISKPLLGVFTTVLYSVGSPVRRLTVSYQAAARTEELEKQLNQALARVSELEQVDQENQQLREMLGAQARPQPSIIGSPIISYGVPTISVGSQQGVIEGSPVLTNGTLVGLIDSVSEQQAVVKLLSQAAGTPVVARTQSGAEGLVIGDGKRVLFTEVAHDQSLTPGERVMTVGQAHIPANIFIGKVQTITSGQSAPVQTAALEQLTSFYEVTLVEVLP